MTRITFWAISLVLTFVFVVWWRRLNFQEQWIDPDNIYIYIYIYSHVNPEQQSLKVKNVKLHRFVELKRLNSPWERTVNDDAGVVES